MLRPHYSCRTWGRFPPVLYKNTVRHSSKKETLWGNHTRQGSGLTRQGTDTQFFIIDSDGHAELMNARWDHSAKQPVSRKGGFATLTQHGNGQDNYERHSKSQKIVLRGLLVFRSEIWASVELAEGISGPRSQKLLEVSPGVLRVRKCFPGSRKSPLRVRPTEGPSKEGTICMPATVPVIVPVTVPVSEGTLENKPFLPFFERPLTRFFRLSRCLGRRFWATVSGYVCGFDPVPLKTIFLGLSRFNLDNEQNSREQQIPAHSCVWDAGRIRVGVCRMATFSNGISRSSPHGMTCSRKTPLAKKQGFPPKKKKKWWLSGETRVEARHIKATHPHFPFFPRFRVRIFRVFFVFAPWNLLGPLFFWVRGTFRIFRIFRTFPISGSNC